MKPISRNSARYAIYKFLVQNPGRRYTKQQLSTEFSDRAASTVYTAAKNWADGGYLRYEYEQFWWEQSCREWKGDSAAQGVSS
ncbi:hypothetical protein NDA01_21790 [Trichocoleus desertorum AS-A10]|uniref:hypothetical protein n=1 Tax=Trichocoleus desertorum TaxID=1481672 RepID=UPI003298700B